MKRDRRVVTTSQVVASINLMRRRAGHRGSTVSRRPGLRGSTVFAHENRPHSRHMRRRTSWRAPPRRPVDLPRHTAGAPRRGERPVVRSR